MLRRSYNELYFKAILRTVFGSKLYYIMLLNPVNIVNLLLITFTLQNLPNTPTTEKEQTIAKEVEEIITGASNDIFWEFVIQDTLEFDDPSEEHEAKIIEDQGDVLIFFNTPGSKVDILKKGLQN
ncbi:hypothetical protein ABEB36_014968 [Hypothenemus hampei]|uniref:Uncharacterized protein n=1 Tax=Hypothenemus hampei TaxID=57062 RepID=A0ABD1E1E0_HYPHA